MTAEARELREASIAKLARATGVIRETPLGAWSTVHIDTTRSRPSGEISPDVPEDTERELSLAHEILAAALIVLCVLIAVAGLGMVGPQ